MVYKAYDTLPTTPLHIMCLKTFEPLHFLRICVTQTAVIYLPVSSVQYDLCPCVKFQSFAQKDHREICISLPNVSPESACPRSRQSVHQKVSVLNTITQISLKLGQGEFCAWLTSKYPQHIRLYASGRLGHFSILAPAALCLEHKVLLVVAETSSLIIHVGNRRINIIGLLNSTLQFQPATLEEQEKDTNWLLLAHYLFLEEDDARKSSWKFHG